MFIRHPFLMVPLWLLAFAGIMAAVPRTVRACSCWPPEEGFVLKNKTVVPRNTSGFAWWGTEFNGDDLVRTLPPKRLFSLEEIRGGRIRKLPFDLEFGPDDPGDATFGDGDLRRVSGYRPVILKPQARLDPSARYRLLFRRRDLSELSGRPRLTGKVQVIEVTVGEALLPSTLAPTLEPGQPTIAPLTVARGVTCRSEISAAQQPVTFHLPTTVEKWRAALLYTTTVDGETLWEPSDSNCTAIPYGSSWMGQGKDLLYARCAGRKGNIELAEGSHPVSMTAWLPGTNLVWRAETRVNLWCE